MNGFTGRARNPRKPVAFLFPAKKPVFGS